MLWIAVDQQRSRVNDQCVWGGAILSDTRPSLGVGYDQCGACSCVCVRAVCLAGAAGTGVARGRVPPGAARCAVCAALSPVCAVSRCAMCVAWDARPTPTPASSPIRYVPKVDRFTL